jgi:CheY-like chemotaxis protein
LPADLDDSRRAMQEAIEQASRLTKQLLAFGRRSVLHPDAIDVREAVASTVDLLKKVIPENIELRLRSAEGAYVALMDRALLEQIVLNLVTNARDAITGQGCILVEIERRDEPRPLLLIRVVDDGAGMDEGVVGRVFEPFFTTKPAGRGTGLGLASVQGAVSQLGGQVRVQSQVGGGSTFEVSLPWIAATLAPAPADVGAAPRPLSILVVDDDDNVRRVTVKMLRGGGHTVEQASDGLAALELIRARPYDLLISDVVMPRMGGLELSDKARKLRPEMAMLLASGYPLDGSADAAKVSFLSKPYRPSELLAHVARLAEPGSDRQP